MQLHRPVLTLLLAAPLVWSASSTSLGLVTADGDFKLNQSVVRGNATLTGDDAVVETLAVPSRISLRGGATLRLDAGSMARVHSGLVTVERGSGEWNAAGNDALETLTLTLDRFKAEGWIRIEGRMIAICRPDALRVRSVNGRHPRDEEKEPATHAD